MDRAYQVNNTIYNLLVTSSYELYSYSYRRWNRYWFRYSGHCNGGIRMVTHPGVAVGAAA